MKHEPVDQAIALDEVDLILVRHARPLLRSGHPASRWVIDPEALPEVDAFAHALASFLPRVSAGDEGNAVVASHEPKALATARELARVWGRRFSQGSGLEEHHRGALPIVDDFTWRATVGRVFSSPETTVLGDETGTEALRRFTTGVEAVMAGAKSRGETLATIVSHATVITLFLAASNQLDSIEFWASLRMPEALLVRWSDRHLVARLGPDGALRRPG